MLLNILFKDGKEGWKRILKAAALGREGRKIKRDKNKAKEYSYFLVFTPSY